MASFLGRAGSSQEPRLPAARILVVGNPGCGKTSVAHLLAAGEPARPAPRPTVGCATHVAQLDGGQAFVELWDVGAHERYKGLRASFYVDISGVIIVYDSTSSRKHASVRKWAGEVAAKGRFAAALPPDQAAGNPGGLPVPCLVVSNKADLRGRGAPSIAGWARRFWAWLDAATRQFKFRRKLQAVLRPASSARLSDASAALNVVSASAKQGIIDGAAVASFFQECLALRHSPSGGSGGAARAARRSVAAGSIMQDAQQPRKPPLPASAGPPPPSFAASLAHGPGGPHSTASSWGGWSSVAGGGGGFISRTASWHSTLSSGAGSEHAHSAWEGAAQQRRGVDAVDDSDDLV